MTFRMLNEWGPCRIAAIAHPNKPIVQYAQISWMGDYRYGRKRCSICDKSVYKPKAQAAPEPSSASSDAAASEGTTRKMSYGTEMTLARNRRNNKAVKIAHDDLIRAKKEFNAAASEGS